MEDVADLYHRKTAGEFRDGVLAGVTLKLDGLVEIIDKFPEPQANDRERGDTWGEWPLSEESEIGITTHRS